ncbi:MAG: tetratricopeptide repeat protein [Ignavibacteriales bacterium]|nr:tetratricopeptide repeat protein [Ignavibacteriales bacterium]
MGGKLLTAGEALSRRPDEGSRARSPSSSRWPRSPSRWRSRSAVSNGTRRPWPSCRPTATPCSARAWPSATSAGTKRLWPSSAGSSSSARTIWAKAITGRPGTSTSSAASRRRAGRSRRPRSSSSASRDVATLSGIVAYKQGRFDDAERDLRQALDLDPAASDAAFHLGRLYADRKDWLNSAIYFSGAAAALEDKEHGPGEEDRGDRGFRDAARAADRAWSSSKRVQILAVQATKATSPVQRRRRLPQRGVVRAGPRPGPPRRRPSGLRRQGRRAHQAHPRALTARAGSSPRLSPPDGECCIISPR